MTKTMTSLIAAALMTWTPVAQADPDDAPAPDPVITVENITPMDPMTAVLSANPSITNKNLIFPGQIITIPGREPHVVVKGDTLNTILSIPAPVGGTVEAPPAVTPPQPPTASATSATPKMSMNWDAVAQCESGGNWGINTGNSYEGGVQFLNSTWRSVKTPDDPPHAYQATREQQIAAAEKLLARSGIGQWPVCGRRG